MDKRPPVGSFIVTIVEYSSQLEVYPPGTLMRVIGHSENSRTPDYFDFQLPNETYEHRYWVASTEGIGKKWDFIDWPWWV